MMNCITRYVSILLFLSLTNCFFLVEVLASNGDTSEQGNNKQNEDKAQYAETGFPAPAPSSSVRATQKPTRNPTQMPIARTRAIPTPPSSQPESSATTRTTTPPTTDPTDMILVALPVLTIQFELAPDNMMREQQIKEVLTHFIRAMLHNHQQEQAGQEVEIGLHSTLNFDPDTRQVTVIITGEWSGSREVAPKEAWLHWFFSETGALENLRTTLEKKGFSMTADSLTIQVNGQLVEPAIPLQPSLISNDGNASTSNEQEDDTKSNSAFVLPILLLLLPVLALVVLLVLRKPIVASFRQNEDQTVQMDGSVTPSTDEIKNEDQTFQMDGSVTPSTDEIIGSFRQNEDEDRSVQMDGSVSPPENIIMASFGQNEGKMFQMDGLIKPDDCEKDGDDSSASSTSCYSGLFEGPDEFVQGVRNQAILGEVLELLC